MTNVQPACSRASPQIIQREPERTGTVLRKLRAIIPQVRKFVAQPLARTQTSPEKLAGLRTLQQFSYMISVTSSSLGRYMIPLLMKRQHNAALKIPPTNDYASATINAALMLPIGGLLALLLTPDPHATYLYSLSFAKLTLVPWQVPPLIFSAGRYYIYAVILCFILAVIGTILQPLCLPQRLTAKTAILAAICVISLLSGFSYLGQIVIYNNGSRLLVCGALGIYLFCLFVYKLSYSYSPYASTNITSRFGSTFPLKNNLQGTCWDLLYSCIIFALFFPSSINALSATWDIHNPHAVAYLFGPSEFARIPGSLPNVTYYSQYSIGLPYLFRHFLSNKISFTIDSYLLLVSVCVVIFSLSYYYLTSRILVSRFWGFFFTIIMAFFLANAISDSISNWGEPSSSPLRFVLFPICAVILLESRFANLRLTLVGACLSGISILLNTETGVYTLLAFLTLAFISSRSWLETCKVVFQLSFGTFFVSLLSCFFCYGSGVFSTSFILDNLEPLVVYSGLGYGNYPLSWTPEHWTWMQCIVMPGLAIVFLAVAYYKNWKCDELSRLDRALVFICAFGLLLLVKFTYRSYMALGHVNSAPLILVFGYCFVSLKNMIGDWAPYRRLLVNFAAFSVVSAGLGLFIFTFRENDPHQDVRIATTWLHYPSLFNEVIGLVPRNVNELPLKSVLDKEIDPDDIALIRGLLTSRSEPGWIFSNDDWAYFLAADRVPSSPVLPITYTLLEKDLDAIRAKMSERPEFVFVDKAFLTPQRHEMLLNYFPSFDDRYRVYQCGVNICAFKSAG